MSKRLFNSITKYIDNFGNIGFINNVLNRKDSVQKVGNVTYYVFPPVVLVLLSDNRSDASCASVAVEGISQSSESP